MPGLVRTLARGATSFAVVALLFAGAAPASAQQSPGSATWQAGTGATGDNTYLGGVDIPASGALLPVDRLLKVSGWFVDSTAQGWAGADDMQVVVGTMGTGKSLAHGTLGVPRPDIAASLNNPYWASAGWTAVIDPGAMPQGQNMLSFSLHTPSKGWWYTQVSVQVGPTAGGVAGPLVDGTPPVVSVTWPRESDRASILSRPWQITGTALDPLAGAKAIDHVEVWLNGERHTLDATYLGDAVPDTTGAWMVTYTPDKLSPLMSNLYVYVHSDVTGKTTLRVVHFEIVDRPL